LARVLAACGIALLFAFVGCSRGKSAEGTWEIAPPTIASDASGGSKVLIPKGSLTIKGDGSFRLTVEGPTKESVSGTWQAQGNVLSFRVKGDDGIEHAFNGALSEDGETLKAFGFEFKLR